MLISKQQLACNVCSQDNSRKELRNICFDRDGAVSTDGMRILIVPYPASSSNDLFETEEMKADAKFKLTFGEKILVHSEQAKQIAAAFFKGDSCIPGVHFAAMEKKDNGDKLISMVNPEQKIHKEFILDESLDDDFPEYQNLLPRSEVTFEAMFSLNLMLDLLNQMKKAQDDNIEEFVQCKFHGQIGIAEMTLGAIRAFIQLAKGPND